MIATLRKFPRTPHLLWLSSRNVRDDKIMTPLEAETFLSKPIVVEEKVDGANVGLSFDEFNKLQVQNRGTFLKAPFTGQWQRLSSWVSDHEVLLREKLPTGMILFGEWCYAKHSIAYSRLPDWFLGFDVFDRLQNQFWSARRRDALLVEMGIVPIHRIAEGQFAISQLLQMLETQSAYYNGPVEGLYLRREDDDQLLMRAKIVRSEFTQNIGKHWSRAAVKMNSRTH
jgi:ATP-dependent RNA circularization protein (DNA/RNA ligase family)